MEKASKPQRRRIALAAGACALAGGSAVFLTQQPRADYPRGAPLVVDLSTLAEGGLRTVDWHGQPVWILRRTVRDLEYLAREGPLLDPDSRHSLQPASCRNRGRSLRPEVFVALGVCTHQGCTPSFRPAEGDVPGSFVCPCHTSRYDLAGRVFRVGPAERNLPVPAHHYDEAGRLVIGEEA